MSEMEAGLVPPPEDAGAAKLVAGSAAGLTEADRKALRRKTIKFVAIFIASVFGLLAAHAALVNTRGNDYYLYQVARSTAYLLNWVGDSAEVIGHTKAYKGDEAYVRACLDAWRKGDETPSPDQYKGTESAPLTAWERWEYSAASERRELVDLLKMWEERGEVWRNDPFSRTEVEQTRSRIDRLQNRDRGPTVTFLLREGWTAKEARARLAMIKAQQDETLNEAERAARVAEKKAKLEEVQSQKAAAEKQDPDSLKDMAFTFVVVPDCGAIPTMVIFVAAVVAFPTRWWKKLLGMCLGVPVLYGINTLRLTVLAGIGAWDRTGAIFKFAHEYVWQGVYIIFVVVVWLAWVELLVKRRNA